MGAHVSIHWIELFSFLDKFVCVNSKSCYKFDNVFITAVFQEMPLQT